MGYHTIFTGELVLSKPLTKEQVDYLHAFAGTRRMSRDVKAHKDLKDPIREAVGLPLGEECGYYVGDEMNYNESFVKYNYNPKSQPGLWCQWIPSDDRCSLIWDGNEKFYNYVKWANYIQEHFLNVWGIEFVDSTVTFQGEIADDSGVLVIIDGKVERAGCIHEW